MRSVTADLGHSYSGGLGGEQPLPGLFRPTIRVLLKPAELVKTRAFFLGPKARLELRRGSWAYGRYLGEYLGSRGALHRLGNYATHQAQTGRRDTEHRQVGNLSTAGNAWSSSCEKSTEVVPGVAIKEHVLLFKHSVWMFDAPFRVGRRGPVEEDIRQGFMRLHIEVIHGPSDITDCGSATFRIGQALQVRFDSIQQSQIVGAGLDDALGVPTAKIDAKESQKIGRYWEHRGR